MNQKFDIIIVGAGPIGLACAIEAEKNNLRHLVIEKGCLVNSIFNYPTNMTFFSTSERLEIGEVPFISHGVKPTRTEALEYYRRVKSAWNLNVLTYEEVTAIEGKEGDFTIITDKSLYKSSSVIIAIGFFDYPNLLGIPGENLPKVRHYYTEPHPYVDKKIIVVGGGNSAVDVALETFRRGTDVTMVVKKDKLEDGVKYWVKPDIENRIEEGSIKAYFNSILVEIREEEVDLAVKDEIITIKNDFVLAMTGYHPDYQFLEKTGINYESAGSKIPVYNPETFESNISGIYLAGVVCGGMETNRWFIENSRSHADKIVDYLIKKTGN